MLGRWPNMDLIWIKRSDDFDADLSTKQTFEFVCPTVARRHVLGAAFLQRLFKLFEQLALMLCQFDWRLHLLI